MLEKEMTEENWDLIIKPKKGLINIDIKEILRYKDLLLMLVKRDVVTVYKQTILGPIWFLVQPVMQMLTFIIIFTKVTHISTDGVPAAPFYLAGIVIWNYFSECLNLTANTFTENADMFGKVYFPRLITPLSKIISGLIKFGIQFSMFIAVYLFYLFKTDAIHPSAWLFTFPFLILLMAGLGLGFGLIFSALTTKYRDLKFLLQFGIQLVMYATPVIYPLSTIPEKYKFYFFINPLSHIIESFKLIFFGTGEFSLYGMIYSTLFMIIVLFLGIIIFNRTQKTFMDTV